MLIERMRRRLSAGTGIIEPVGIRLGDFDRMRPDSNDLLQEHQIMIEEGGTKGSNPIRPFLMFSGERHGQAEAAINFYTSTFPASRIISIEKYGPKQAEPEGTVRCASFVLNGQDFMAIDSAAPHAFNFTPSLSLYVNSPGLSDFDGLVGRLSEGGNMLMPPNNYGFSRKFAWFNDRFGVSWQVNCE
jgi:predicted 3-demethylubiquinone-9 3-methyltransferase (glyoxalase superfamily)